ncbi:hypothetical protein Tco_0864674 [Tanacetum coccineum]
MKDTIMQDNSQVKFKKTEVEDHHRITSISNKTKSVIACNDSLKSRILNVNDVCATCGNCVFYSNHDACVSKYLNDVNAITKKHKEVPIRSNLESIPSSSNSLADCSTHPLHCWNRCTKHMTDNLQLLCYLVDKYLGILRFGNDQFAPIFGYEDLVQGNTMIERVYNAEGLHHNLFSVGQFCDADLEIAFKKSTCFVGDLQGNNLLLSTRGSDLYKITLQDLSLPNLICLPAKASPTQAWLWHR